MKTKKEKSEFGKALAEKRWGSRKDMIVELSKLIDKSDLNWIQAKWKTTHIATLIKYLRKNGHQ